MNGLQWTNAVVLAIAGTMAVMMGVVCLLYGVHLDDAPQLRAQWPLLIQFAAIFTTLALIAGATFFGERRNKSWHWYGQALLALAIVGSGWLLWTLLIG